MTEVTHRRILSIAFPIVLANFTVPLLGLVDTGVVGQMGTPEPIGAVGLGALLLSSIYWVCGFLRMGTTGLTSQAVGAGDVQEVSALLKRGLLVGFGFGLFVILAQWPLFAAAFKLAPASDTVENLARDYMVVRVWSAPATIAMYALTGWLIARERTRAVLVQQIVMNVVNIGLDLLFVLQFDWGVTGVAWATFAAEWSGLVVGLWFCRDGIAKQVGWPLILHLGRLRRMAAVNGDIMLRTLALQAVVVLFVFWGARMGDVPLAANEVLMQFVMLTAFGLDGFAFAAETLVGQAMGRRDPVGLRAAAKKTSFWGVMTSVAMAIVFAVFGGAIIDVLTTSQEVRETARVYLPYMVLGPMIGLPAWMLDGIFIGATRTRDMRNMMALSLVIYVVSAFPLMGMLGNHGLWLAMIISWIARGITLGLRYPALERAAA